MYIRGRIWGAIPEAYCSWQPPGMHANILFLLKSNFIRASWGCMMSIRHALGADRIEMSETEMMLKGYGLTTAGFLYHMPDYVHVLNTFVWQDYDIAPDHPRLFKFI